MSRQTTVADLPARRSRLRFLLVALLSAFAFTVTLGASRAAAASPWWYLTQRMVPSHLAPGGEGTIVVQAINLGNATTSGNYSFTDNLPTGLAIQEAHFFARPPKSLVEAELVPDRARPDFGPNGEFPFEYCSNTSNSITCTSESPLFGGEELFLLQSIVPYDFIEMKLKVKDEGAEPGALNEIKAGGGGGPSTVTAKHPIPITGQAAGFGIEEFTLVPEDEGGQVDTHAGSHPYQLTSTVGFNRDSTGPLSPPAMPRNLHFRLPPGQVGNATALPQCNDQDFAHIGRGGEVNLCPLNTAIGVVVATASTNPCCEEHFTVPIFNLTPAVGEPARFGFEVARNPVILDTAVRSGSDEDYGVTVNVSNVTQLVNFISATTVFWGAPGDPSHNEARGWGCLLGGPSHFVESEQICVPSVEPHPPAFLTLPTNCAAPFNPSVEGVSWPTKAAPGGLTFAPVAYNLQDHGGNPLSLTGCNGISFHPTIAAEPSAQSASSPSGLDFNLNFDDEGLTNASGTAQSELKDSSVALPVGLAINPSAGVGLGGCTLADYARETVDSLPGEGCPNNSKLGTVEITTPLLASPVDGAVFIAQPYENLFSEPGHPNGSLTALYIVAKNPVSGVLVKLAGRVDRDPLTGQLTTVFQDNPQLPFAHFNLHFREGQQAPLITPPTCGAYTTQALLTPWSEPLATLTNTSTFTITQGPGGGACPSGIPPFSPQIVAGTTSNAAGGFTPFYLRLSRGDGESEITSFSTLLPPGMTGILTGIPFCSDEAIALAQAKSGTQEKAEPSCPASQLGESEVGAGVGAVLAYAPGKVYLAGPYNGDPFSLVSVTSAVVGPFDLGTVVIRFGLRIDPHTAQVSVDPTASEPIPHIIDGIVTHVRDIRVHINRPGFTLNPTSCAPMSVSSTLGSNFGQSFTSSSPFQAASCQSLKFAPQFSVSTTGKTSKANGAGLSVKLTYPTAPLGTYANIAKVKVSLPKQLPSRLTTLQKACLAPVFDANPADCPAAAIVGKAKVITQVLPVPLEGDAYFVSHGGEAFPDLTIVLKGYGVTVDLVGSTQIKNGITTSTFKATPDVPFQSFELNLPQGPNSALTANTNLCASKLTMPTEFTAQNGTVLNQATQIKVSGCKSMKLTNAQKLQKALKQCHKKTNKGKRKACERQARKRYSVKRHGKAGKTR